MNWRDINYKSLGWKFVVLVLLAALIFLWIIKAPVMSWYLTRTLKLPVSVGRISTWPSETTIHHFKLKNPHGFKVRRALTAKKVLVQYGFKKLFRDPTEIDLIELDDVFLSVEFNKNNVNNWVMIGKRMPKSKSHREVIIHKLVVKNLKVAIQGAGIVPDQTKIVDRLELDEIDSKNGFPTSDLVRQIFQGAGIEDLIKEVFNPGELIEKIFPFLGDGEVPAQGTGS